MTTPQPTDACGAQGSPAQPDEEVGPLFDESTLASLTSAALRVADEKDHHEAVASTIRRLVRHLRREVAQRPYRLTGAHTMDFGGTVSCGARLIPAPGQTNSIIVTTIGAEKAREILGKRVRDAYSAGYAEAARFQPLDAPYLAAAEDCAAKYWAREGHK